MQVLCDYFSQFGVLMSRCQETLRQSDYFTRAATELRETTLATLIEVGPGPGLGGQAGRQRKPVAAADPLLGSIF